MEKTYLLDILKIVEGAVNVDHDKVMAYARQLCERLETDGEKEAAKRLKQILGGSKVSKMGLAKLNGGFAPANGTRSLPVDSESRLPTADEERFSPDAIDLFLAPNVEKVVHQFLVYFRAADRLIASGVGITPSLLMFGPPGCGKTQLAKHIAAELQLPLITSRIDVIVSSYLGSTAKNLRLLFEHAASRPCVLFLDEFDALAKMRDDTKELGELKRVVISLLQNIDALGKDHVILAATNHEHLLDPAVWRRFSYKVRLVEPMEDAREKMLRKFFGSYAGQEVIETLVTLSEGLTGAELRLIADDCIRDAVLDNREAVSLRQAVEATLDANPKVRTAGTELAARVRAMRHMNPRIFTQTRLAEIFETSQSHISKMLKEDKP